jgi:endonuclease-3
MKNADIEFLFATLQRANPNPASELLYSSTFELLAAVVLSAQATDASVNRATRRLFALAPTPQTMFAMGEAALCEHIRSIGLYRTKAKHLIEACRILLQRHDGQVPRDRDALQALPGVGRKTANVVLNVAFGEPTMAVDTHVFRVANRTGLAPGSTAEAVEQKLLAAVPDPYRTEAHHWLILHGRYVCTARSPDCRACGIHGLCAAYAASGGAPTLQLQ